MKETHGGSFDRKSMQTASGQRNTVTLLKEIASCSTRAVTTNSPNFEPVPYKVVEKKGNAVLIEDQEGNTKLRNTSHMKKFPLPGPCTEATEASGADEAEDMPTGRQAEATALIPPPNIETHPTLPPESSASPLPSRPTRVRRPPAWMSDFVSFCA